MGCHISTIVEAVTFVDIRPFGAFGDVRKSAEVSA
jgi:hypothetical protein